MRSRAGSAHHPRCQESMVLQEVVHTLGALALDACMPASCGPRCCWPQPQPPELVTHTRTWQLPLGPPLHMLARGHLSRTDSGHGGLVRSTSLVPLAPYSPDESNSSCTRLRPACVAASQLRLAPAAAAHDAAGARRRGRHAEARGVSVAPRALPGLPAYDAARHSLLTHTSGPACWAPGTSLPALSSSWTCWQPRSCPRRA